MKIKSLTGLILLGVCGQALANTKVLNLPHREAHLANGLRVYMVRYPTPGVVAYELPVRVGSRNEVEKGKTGFAHFFEHLMFRGTKKRSSKEFGDLYVRLGVENNAWTGNDLTNYHGVVATAYLPQILEAEADRFRNLKFDEKALKDEAGAVLGEYHKDVAQPEFLLEEKLVAAAFQAHPYGHTTMGYKADIQKFTERYRDVWPFFWNYYRPGNVSIVLVGDFDFNEALRVVERQFGPWKNPPAKPAAIPPEPEQKEPRVVRIKADKPTQKRLAVAYKVPAFSTKNNSTAVLTLLSEIYFSVTSEFQKKYLYEKKWLDHVSAAGGESADPGLWTVTVRFSETGRDKESEVLQAIESVVAEMRQASPEEARLAATRQRVKNALTSGWFSSPDQLAGRIAWYTSFEPDFGVLDRVYAQLARVQGADLVAYARKNLIDEHKTVITLEGAAQ